MAPRSEYPPPHVCRQCRRIGLEPFDDDRVWICMNCGSRTPIPPMDRATLQARKPKKATDTGPTMTPADSWRLRTLAASPLEPAPKESPHPFIARRRILFAGVILWVGVLMLPWWRVTEYHDDKVFETHAAHLFYAGALGQEYPGLVWQTIVCGLMVVACLGLTLQALWSHRKPSRRRDVLVPLSMFVLALGAAVFAAATWDQGREPGFFVGQAGGTTDGGTHVEIDAWPTWGYWLDVAAAFVYATLYWKRTSTYQARLEKQRSHAWTH